MFLFAEYDLCYCYCHTKEKKYSLILLRVMHSGLCKCFADSGYLIEPIH